MGSLALKSFSFLWFIWPCHPAQHYRIENKQLKKEFLTSSEAVSNINCSTVVSILLDFLQTQGVIFYTVSLFECLLLVRFWNEICLSILFYYIFHLLQPCYRNIYFFAVSCCWGEVVVPSDDLPETQRINKTAKHWTIIIMRVEPEHKAE